MRWMTTGLLLLFLGTAQADVLCDGSDDQLTSGVAFSNVLTAAAGTILVWYTMTGDGPGVASCYQGGTLIGDTDGYLGLGHVAPPDTMCVWQYSGGSAQTVKPTPAPGSPHHLGWVHGGGTLFAYDQGVVFGSTGSGDTDDLATNLAVCRAAGTTANGTVSEILVYNVALSASEIAALAGRRRYGAGSTQPTAHWRLDSCADGAACAGVSFVDGSGNGRTLTGVNGPTGRASAVLTRPEAMQ